MRNIAFGDILEVPLPADIPPHDFVQEYHESTFCIYILEHVLDQIHQQATAAYSVESGGILIGHPFININSVEQKFVVITDCVQTNSENKSRSHFTVAPEELIRARKKTEDDFPGLIAVGWYHSHPGLGVFLSSQDMQIVRSVYNADWHVAYVLDHIKGQHDFFYGKAGTRAQAVYFLKQRPACIEAIWRFNVAVASSQSGDSSELEKFRHWLLKNKSPELTHWRIKKIYQELSLVPNQKSGSQLDKRNMHNDELRIKGNRTKIDRLIEQAELYLSSGSVYMVLPQIEQILRLCLDEDASSRLSAILQDLNKTLK